MTAIIIEDEALAARELESILKKLAPEIEIVARQDSVRGSVQWLKENQVDLIFSDVHLGDGRSFDIFGQVEIKAPVIFITAYDEYALQAFKSQGIDYILKPFDEEEILRALEKVRNWFAKEKKAPRTVRFQERFLVQIGTKIKSVPVAEVAYFMADGKYLMLYTHEGGGYILDQTMAALEERLDPQIFFRINRKFIVSFSAIKEMIRYSNNRIKIGLSPYSRVPGLVEPLKVIQRHNNKKIPDNEFSSGIFLLLLEGRLFPIDFVQNLLYLFLATATTGSCVRRFAYFFDGF